MCFKGKTVRLLVMQRLVVLVVVDATIHQQQSQGYNCPTLLGWLRKHGPTKRLSGSVPRRRSIIPFQGDKFLH